MIFYLSHEISDNTDIYWFESSNKYVIVDKSFSEILSIKLGEKDDDKFIEKIKKTLDLAEENYSKIAQEMNEFILECPKPSINEIIETNTTPKKDYINICYRFNKKTVRVNFDSELTKNLIHPKFFHLQTNEDYKISAELTIFSENNKIFMFKDKEYIGEWDKKNMHEFQGKFSMELTSSFYGKIENDWMGVFHASAIGKNNDAIMLTGDSGNGKSSLATILSANGYDFISDDFTPILCNDSHVYSFPSAISIKESFFDLASSIFNEFEELESVYVNDIKGWVKYLPPKSQNAGSFNCNKVIHVNYDEKGSNELLKIDNTIAIKQFLPDAWIASNKKHAKKFITWIINTDFYSLHYNDNQKAIKLINKLI